MRVAFNSYKIKFEANGGLADEDMSVPLGANIGVLANSTIAHKPESPTKTGYTFSGWQTAPAGGSPWDFDNDIVTQDTVLYAKWKEKVAKPAVTNTALVYDGNVKSAGIAAHAGYTITNGTATNAGGHSAEVSLDTANYVWDDETAGDITLPWAIAKAAGAASAAPILVGKTHNGVTINAVAVATNGQSAEYGISATAKAPTAWQTGLTFANLNPDTDYYIFARTAENANYHAGAVSAPLEVTTDVAPTNPINKPQKSDGRVGIKLSKNIVSDKTEFEVILPNDKVLEVKAVIYDNTGNVVFEKVERGASVSWDLTNGAGRGVANGTYLIIAEAKGAKGTYAYSAKVGVKR